MLALQKCRWTWRISLHGQMICRKQTVIWSSEGLRTCPCDSELAPLQPFFAVASDKQWSLDSLQGLSRKLLSPFEQAGCAHTASCLGCDGANLVLGVSAAEAVEYANWQEPEAVLQMCIHMFSPSPNAYITPDRKNTFLEEKVQKWGLSMQEDPLLGKTPCLLCLLSWWLAYKSSTDHSHPA